jgi:phytanoyl-CoA hydroxylase
LNRQKLAAVSPVDAIDLSRPNPAIHWTVIVQPINTIVRHIHAMYSAPKLLRDRLHYRLNSNPPGPKVWSKEKQAFWEEHGYVVLEQLYDDAQIGKVNRCVDDIWTKQRVPNPRISADVFIGSKQERRAYVDQVEETARQQPYKLNDLYLVSDEALSLILGDVLTAVLSDILQDIPIVCNTLNLEFGSQQDYHTDTLYMPAISGVRGSPYHCNMAASWIALEDGDKDAGLLQYYPGSHKIPPFYFSRGQLAADPSEFQNYKDYMAEEIDKRNLKPTTFKARKGDVLIWHELLYHGGSEIVDEKKTRKSLVTHYFRTSDVPELHRQRYGRGFYLNREPHSAPP